MKSIQNLSLVLLLDEKNQKSGLKTNSLKTIYHNCPVKRDVVEDQVLLLCKLSNANSLADQ